MAAEKAFSDLKCAIFAQYFASGRLIPAVSHRPFDWFVSGSKLGDAVAGMEVKVLF